MSERRSHPLEAAIFIILLTAMYYYNTQYVNVGIHLMYKGLIGLFIMLLSFGSFLFSPDLLRFGKLFKTSIILILPNMIIACWSMFSWGMSFTTISDMSRGLSSQVYQMVAVFSMAGLLYLFGERGIWYNLFSMLAANLILIAKAIGDQGILAYLKELQMTVFSFAAKTGDLMKQTEIHELTFALGLYLLYFFLCPKEIKKHWLLAAIAAFCYLSGFKRIGALAITASILAGWSLYLLKEKPYLGPILTILGLIETSFMFAYVACIYEGIFDTLVKRLGIDTMGRSDLYHYIKPYYEMSPFFMGRGAGFVSRLFSDNSLEYFSQMGALHNDFLQLYVDIGFIGFLLWAVSLTIIRTSYALQEGKGKILCFCFILYCLITYATDNTYYYPYVNSAAAILILGYHFLAEKENLKRSKEWKHS